MIEIFYKFVMYVGKGAMVVGVVAFLPVFLPLALLGWALCTVSKTVREIE